MRNWRWPITNKVALFCSLLALGFLWAGEAAGQRILSPGAERPEPPSPTPEPAPELEFPLPPPPAPPGPEDRPLDRGVGFHVERFIVEGSSVFDETELQRLVAPWSGRMIASSDLVAAREAITQHYIANGYVTSGAIIPDQDPADGVVRIEVVEGVLEDVVVTGTKRFRPVYFRTRLERAGRSPVNVYEIEEALQLLQRKPSVERIAAELRPGEVRGQSVLSIAVEEAPMYGLAGVMTNEHSPAVGALGGIAYLSFDNLAGVGDRFSGSFDGTEGLQSLDVAYVLPLNRFDTTFDFRYRRVDSEIVTDEFKALEIESEFEEFRVRLSQPLYRSLRQEFRISFAGEYRESRTTLLGDAFCIDDVTDDCETVTSVLRLAGDWSWRSARDAIAARSRFSFGIHALGSDRNSSNDLPDSEFFAWLGQIQWVHRFPEVTRGLRLLARGDVQIANEALPAVERFSVGGSQTVRGYYENELVRDNGLVGSLELQYPVWRDSLGLSIVELAAFTDAGYSWAADGVETLEQSSTLVSIGLGMIATPFPGFRAELYWGHQLKDTRDRDTGTIQDQGITFRIVVTAF